MEKENLDSDDNYHVYEVEFECPYCGRDVVDEVYLFQEILSYGCICSIYGKGKIIFDIEWHQIQDGLWCPILKRRKEK